MDVDVLVKYVTSSLSVDFLDDTSAVVVSLESSVFQIDASKSNWTGLFVV